TASALANAGRLASPNVATHRPRGTPAAPTAAPAPETPATPPAGSPETPGVVAIAGGTDDVPVTPATPPDGPHTATLQRDFGRHPLLFERNDGQADPSTRFLAYAPDHALALTPTGATLTLPARTDETGQRVRDTLGLQFVGANPDATLVGENELTSRSNYFRAGAAGAPPLKITDVSNYGAVASRGLYPGVDAVYHSDAAGRLEYDLRVQPGFDTSAVRVAFTGASATHVDEQGRLVLDMPGGQVIQESPVLYQIADDGQRQPVTGQFTLAPNGTVGFEAGAHDATRPLVIDPVLSYSTYLGSALEDAARAVASDLVG